MLGSLGALGIAISLIAGYDGNGGQLTHVINTVWISSLGIHYSLGLNGLNLFLVAMTTFVFALSVIASNLRSEARPELYFLLLGIAESAVLGAFLAQDLALFVGFFDLMLIPFYFLTGMFGGPGAGEGDDEARHLHPRRVAADARRRGRPRRADRPR